MLARAFTIHIRAHLHIREVDPGKAKIANFQVAIAIYEQIPRLQISVNNIARVQEEHAAEYLVEEELDVGLAELLG